MSINSHGRHMSINGHSRHNQWAQQTQSLQTHVNEHCRHMSISGCSGCLCFQQIWAFSPVTAQFSLVLLLAGVGRGFSCKGQKFRHPDFAVGLWGCLSPNPLPDLPWPPPPFLPPLPHWTWTHLLPTAEVMQVATPQMPRFRQSKQAADTFASSYPSQEAQEKETHNHSNFRPGLGITFLSFNPLTWQELGMERRETGTQCCNKLYASSQNTSVHCTYKCIAHLRATHLKCAMQ